MKKLTSKLNNPVFMAILVLFTVVVILAACIGLSSNAITNNINAMAANYSGSYSGDYSGDYSGAYDDDDYSGDYSGAYDDDDYSGDYSGAYDDDDYSGSYSGDYDSEEESTTQVAEESTTQAAEESTTQASEESNTETPAASTEVAAIKSVKLSKTTYVYNGKKRKPTVTVKDVNGDVVSSEYYTVTYAKGRKNVGKYKVTITFTGVYASTKTYTRYFTITPKANTTKSVKAAKKSITVKLTKKTSQTTGYQIQYATNKKFTKNKKTVTLKSNKTTSKKITGLKSNTKYYVRVRTYKTVKVNGKSVKVYSSWSSVKSVKTTK